MHVSSESASNQTVHNLSHDHQLPHDPDILRQITKCLKPGGRLLVEESDDDCFWDDGGCPGPKLETLLHAWHRSMRERGAEPCIGRLLEAELRSLGAFAEVNTYYIDIPLSGKSSGQLLDSNILVSLIFFVKFLPKIHLEPVGGVP